jgi:hypothetical protein
MMKCWLKKAGEIGHYSNLGGSGLIFLNTPVLQYSITPVSRYSITPTLQYSS